MPNCSVYSCKKRSNTSSVSKDNVSFHLFPKDTVIRDIWSRACGNHVSWTPKRTSTICSEHFETSCFIIQSNNKKRLKQSAVPTLKLSKVEPCEESEPGTSESIKIKVETIKIEVETYEDPHPPQTQECITNKDQPHTSQSESHICNSPKSTFNSQLEGTPREIKLKNLLKIKNKQIKGLQSQKRYLKKKVAGLQETLNELTEKSLIDKEDRLVLDKIGVEEKATAT